MSEAEIVFQRGLTALVRIGSKLIWLNIPRGYPHPSSAEGNGHKPQVEAYRFQGLAIATCECDYEWLIFARAYAKVSRRIPAIRCVPAGELKHNGETTPFGTSLATVARGGIYNDYLSAPCGNCGSNVAACRCAKTAVSEGV